MQVWFKKVLKTFFLTLAGLLTIILLYFLAAFVLSVIPVNSIQPTQVKYTIYLISNGVHVDIALPYRNNLKDWSDKFALPAKLNTSVNYVSFGWGDKQFYQTTPEWSDLKMNTALKAMFLKSEAAMHLYFYSALSPSEKVKEIKISEDQYIRLTQTIERSFAIGANNQFVSTKGAGYGQSDMFYNANGFYTLFYTCNTWTNECLKTAGIKSCVWTPFAQGVMFQY